jgi:hypothetical protein
MSRSMAFHLLSILTQVENNIPSSGVVQDNYLPGYVPVLYHDYGYGVY